ncbi:MAG TPA: asparagine synthase (glutamine-hydrolyzing) [Burkholderiales bacterium]|nr:asparagine synthase (glutamine-hydrolyzing) [Burkholderiales bacterium]
MCAIAGWAAPTNRAPEDRAVHAMLDAMHHRGPDGAGHAAFTAASGAYRVMLGHRRLAIIDPNGSRQPMRDDAAGLTLSFNGEIYNFRELRAELEAKGFTFERDSDTEVLLRAYQHWGAAAVERLRGQFAFAVWDARNDRLFLARDRFGEKPLYLCEAHGALYFASEAKALLALPGVPRDIDLASVWDYLAYRYVPGPHTLLNGIRKLAPGTTATWQRGHLRETRYWTPPDKHPLGGHADLGSATVPAFLKVLEEAVATQMVSDVPFGAFLSGGLDSSVIVALMTRHCAKVKTFAVGFAGDRNCELPHAAFVAQRFGTEHHEITVSHREFTDYLPQLVAVRDAPVSEPSDVAIYLLAREARRSVKMVLTGEGSDEILGGYRKHVAEGLAWMYRGLPGLVRRTLLAPLAYSLPARYRELKIAAASLSCDDWRERYVRWFGAMDFRQRAALSRLRVHEREMRDDRPPFDADPDTSALRRLLYFDQTSWLPDNLLERGDRMTMAASIEARVPFLDHKLAEFVSTLPDHWRVDELRRKRVLREAAAAVLPREILMRRKVGFRVPMDQWFAGGLRDYLLEHLRSRDSLTRVYYDTRALDRILDEHLGGAQAHDKLLWTLLTLEIWQRHYRSSALQKEGLACAA